jgi:hypothetical protein
MKKMKKTLELTYEEVEVLLDLVLISQADTADEPTARVLAHIGDLYRQFTAEENLSRLVESAVHEVQTV